MLTLEERERFAYITNSPDHALAVLALDADDEQRAELKGANEAADEAEERATKLSGEVEDLEIQVGDLEEKLGLADETIGELREQIHAAGVDLV